MHNDIEMIVKTKPTYRWPVLDGGTVHLTKEGVFLLHQISGMAIKGAVTDHEKRIAAEFREKAHELYVTAPHNT